MLQQTRTQQNGLQLLECHASREFGAWQRVQAHIQPTEPVRAPAVGQSAVLYDGDYVLGGGFIF